LCEISAPTFDEAERAAAYQEALREAGLEDVRIDDVGNVIAVRRGAAARPNLLFTAHLDTVFPAETDVSVTRDGNILRGPGILDDCRGLAVVLGVARALNRSQIQTAGTITFAATVGEEGLGDLLGVKHLFGEELRGEVDRFISVETAYIWATHVGVGSRRYRITFRGPGGHSWGRFGLVSPIHALGRAIEGVSRIEVPEDPKTTFNVGLVDGGTSVNTIAEEASMVVDMRSVDPDSLARLEERFLAAVHEALAAENARGEDEENRLTVDIDLVGDRPAGETAEESAIVHTAAAVADALELPMEYTASSTDSNLPMSLGIPALTISGGGSGGGAHSTEEWFDTSDSFKGTQWAFLIALALAEQEVEGRRP
jgi:acetylornithine deacetylase/succinyl-diaminopimelate desuccinylase-like protein